MGRFSRFQLTLASALLLLGLSDVFAGTYSQQCYYADNIIAPTRFVPCGDPSLEHTWCCETGDICLSNNACYNGQFGVTYLAGCTDSSYDDDTCPEKPGFEDHVWAGLVYCNGTSDQWVACDDSGPTVTTPSYCYCPTTSATVAFTASSVLENIMSLGASAGTYFCYPGYAAACAATATSSAAQSAATSTTSPQSQSSLPTTTSGLPRSTLSTSTSTSTSTSDAISSTGSANAIITSASLASNTSLGNSSTGLSDGAKSGVIAGGTFAALGICTVCGLFCQKLYRRKQKPTPIEEQIRRDSLDGTEGSMEKAASDSSDPRSPMWSGHRSELPADSIVSPVTPYEPEPYRPSPRISEIQGSPTSGGRGRPIGPGVYEMPA